MHRIITFTILLCCICLVTFSLLGCFSSPNLPVSKIAGFSENTNRALEAFFNRHAADQKRKVAVFDFDGTLIGQVPYYASDEFFMEESDTQRIQTQELPPIDGLSQDKSPMENYKLIEGENHNRALLWRIQTYAGQPADEVRQRALRFYQAHYQNKIYEPMRQLVSRFISHSFEVWVITGSPELYVDLFIPLNYGVPASRVLGVKTVIRDGAITADAAGPITDQSGKADAIDTFIKVQPFFVAGNSMGDTYMLNKATDMALVINPSTKLSELASMKGWLIEHIPDLPTPESTHHYKKHGIQPNR